MYWVNFVVVIVIIAFAAALSGYPMLAAWLISTYDYNRIRFIGYGMFALLALAFLFGVPALIGVHY